MADEKQKKPEPRIKQRHREFCLLYSGIANEGKCYMNATRSYIVAYRGEIIEKEKDPITERMKYTGEYWTCKTKASILLSKGIIKEWLNWFWGDTDRNKMIRRLNDIAFQNKDIKTARQATVDVLKVTGEFQESTKHDIPELERLTDVIQEVLSK